MTTASAVDTTSLSEQLNSNKQKPIEPAHKLHPSIANTVATGNVTNSPFLSNKQKNIEYIHINHTSISNIANSNKVKKTKVKFDETNIKKNDNNNNNNNNNPRPSHIVNPPSVYVLDEAKLAEKGIDFWENHRDHSRVNTEWWLNQLKMRKLMKKQNANDTNISMSLTSRNNVENNNNLFDDDIEESVIYKDTDLPKDDALSPTVDDNGNYDDLNEEFETLLEDYRIASKQVLQSEKEKAENMVLLNEQKELINTQNEKIKELQRQLQVFDDTVKQSNELNNKNNKSILEKLEQNLSMNTRNVQITEEITKQITEKVNTNYNKQINDNYNGLLMEEMAKKDKELEILKNKLNEKETVANSLRNELNKVKDDIIGLQERELKENNDTSEMKDKLKQKEYENKNLLKTINDLKYELEMQQKRQNDDDVKQQNNLYINQGNDENEPLLNKQIDNNASSKMINGRTPRNHKKQTEYIGLQPKQYFLQRQWCCGFVCCDNACGCGSY